LNRVIQTEILNPLALMILRGEVLDGETAYVTVLNNKMTLNANHEVVYDGSEDLEDMDLDVEDLE
jgi:ATP-dependent Clp protease ATP-binding subunit ClpB